MATEDKNNLDFLRFSAYSMKELITRKLSQDSAFTDQIYEGSNLAILIDLVSYMYQCLVYQLNSAAAESMFADTQIYENIQRLVQLLGYQARGCSPASVSVRIRPTADLAGTILLKYSYLDTGIPGPNGTICFSTAQPPWQQGTGDPGQLLNSDDDVTVTLYNGRWRLYDRVFTASGVKNETFTLTGLRSDASSGQNVAADFIDVVVQDSSGNFYSSSRYPAGDARIGNDHWQLDASGLFTNYDTAQSGLRQDGQINIYNPQSAVYTAYLNQSKTYEIKFGDGVTGRTLAPGDRVYVFYLQTDGAAGNVDLASVDWAGLKFRHAASDFGLTTYTGGRGSYDQIFDVGTLRSLAGVDPEDYELQPASSAAVGFRPEQGVEDIRRDAPQVFKTGNRLVTKSDYEYFVANSQYVREQLGSALGGGSIVDVKCMNNVQYVTSFYKWLYLNGLNHHGDGRYYFDARFWNRTGYQHQCPADANNTYLWIKTSDVLSHQGEQYVVGQAEQRLNDVLAPFKTMTTELKVQKPVYVDFDVCANPDMDDVKTRYIAEGTFDADAESYIEVTLDDNVIFVGTSVQKSICEIIEDAFSPASNRLGRAVDFTKMLDKIYAINGVSGVRTVYSNPDTGEYNVYNGLSFASWSPVLQDVQGLDAGDATSSWDDLEVSNSSRSLEEFQFPVFVGGQTLASRIKLVKKSLVTVNPLKY